MRYQLAECFIQENHAWDDLIARHKGEIPQLRHRLGAVLSRKRVVGDDTRAGVDQLCSEMGRHEASMGSLREHLADQQHHLRRLTGHDLSADADSLSRQNLLRERIRHAERAFIDLKCEMLNYLSIIA